tara:strand:- start:325 stop:777 length:453 start_codon:yes stop_codon:yes gene_type:complete
MTERTFATRRQSVVAALVEKLKQINGTGTFLSDVDNNVHPRLKFWDEVDQFPAIHLNAGSETREYLGAGQRHRFLTITIRCYVRSEEAPDDLDMLLEDVETVIENNSALTYTDRRGVEQTTHQISVVSLDTDEGVLEPLGVGELLIEVRY